MIAKSHKEKLNSTFLKIALVIIFLYLFLVSIGLMGAAFKGYGKEFAETLLNTTSNSFIALFIGILATSLVQSSSTTTSIVVGLVASGVITTGNAVPIIMGANIGTTVTNTLVSMGHITRREEFKRAIAGATVHDFFNLICVGIMFPLELATGFLHKFATYLAEAFVFFGGIKFTSPVKTLTKPTVKFIQKFFTSTIDVPYNLGNTVVLIISFVFLFVSLYYIVKIMRSLVISRIETALHNVLGGSGFIAIVAGLVFTVIVQSSSITTSLLIPLIGAGILTIDLAFPITMGANIGTTATAILASFATGNISAITIAFVHFLFNCIGVLCIYPIPIFRRIPIFLSKELGKLAFKKRRYAMGYVVGLFFVLPTILIVISKMFK
jgi:sodium-dependent phosphate cotransporter